MEDNSDTGVKSLYSNLFGNRYPEWGEKEDPPKAMVRDVTRWLDRWPEFDRFLETLTDEGFLGEMVLKDLQVTMAASPKETWSDGLIDRIASTLGWYALEIAFLMDNLEKRRSEEGAGQALANLEAEGGYLNQIDRMNQERESLLAFYRTHSDLFAFVTGLFFDILRSAIAEEKTYQFYLKILETENVGQRLQGLATFFREQIYENIVGQMLIWVGFYHYLQTHKESGEH